MNPETFISAVNTAYDKLLNEDRRPKFNPNNVYASQFHPCVRRHVLSFQHSDTLPEFNSDTLARFKRGEDRERDLKITLNRIGQYSESKFEVIGVQERVEIKDGDIVLISGKMDAVLKTGDLQIPVEIKSWHPNVSQRIETILDMIDNHWTRKAVFQLAFYIACKKAPFGYFILDTPVKPKWILMTAEQAQDYFKDFRQLAFEAMLHKTTGVLPDFYHDLSECKHCEFFGSFCSPPTSSDCTKLLLDPDLETDVRRLIEIREVGKEFEHLDKSVKERLRGVESGICGNVLIQGKWSPTTRYNLPDEAKKQIEDIKKPYAVKDPKGQFRLKMEAL